MHALLALAALGFGISFVYGWACWFIPLGQRDWLTLGLTTFGLSLGGLTLFMFWLTLLLPGRLALIPILSGCGVVGIAGLWLKRGDLRPACLPRSSWRAIRTMGAVELALAAVIALGCLGILFNSIYWPFGEEDALAIYAPIAREIFQTGILPTGLHLYDGYPAMVQMAYVYSHLAYGNLNEYLARLVPALMAIGAVGVAGALGREMRSVRAGVFAAGLMMLTPFFPRWASSGYVDIPGSFYFGLCGVFAWRWWQDGDARSAALTGIAAGLAMWTKNDALTLWVSLAALLALRWWLSRRKVGGGEMAPLKWRQITWLGGAILATGGPWYVRNVIVFQFIIPPTLWTYAAQHTAGTLLGMAWSWQDFGVTGLVFTAAIFYGALRFVWHQGARSRSGWAILLIMALPFYAAWWWLASYDIRFLLMILPLLAVLAGLMLDDAVMKLQTCLSPGWAARARWIALCSILVLSPFALRNSVNYKGTILSRPLMSDAEKHRVVLGGLYDLALAVNGLPAGSRIVGVPSIAHYYIDLARFAVVSEKKIDVPPSQLVGSYDYVAYRFAEGRVPSWAQDEKPLLQMADGYVLYAIQESQSHDTR